MKFHKFNRSALCLAMAMLFASFSVFSPLLVKGELIDYPTPRDREMLYAFWQQEAYDGMINGEAVYDYEFPEDVNTLFAPHYGGTWRTDLVDTTFGGISAFRFEYSIPYWFEVESPEGNYSIDCWLDVNPDLYGDLDLSGTSTVELRCPNVNQTHISSVNLDDAFRLKVAMFNYQPFCTEFSALNCPKLYWVEAMNCAYTNIAFQPRVYTEPLMISTFGSGTVGAYYKEAVSRDTATLYAEDGDFLGWFANGSLVSTEYEYVHEGGGEVIACFAGDANGDGRITVADATTTARYALSLIEAQSTLSMMDANANGVIEIADAVMIARFALGV